MESRKSQLGFIIVREEDRDKLLDVNVFKGPEYHPRVVRMDERYEINVSEFS